MRNPIEVAKDSVPVRRTSYSCPFVPFVAVFMLMFVASVNAQVTDKIDWPAFMARHDLVWNEVPANWQQGAFMGNGLLGTMVFAGEGGSLRWRVGRTDVTFHGMRMPIGELLLHPSGKIQSASMRLDLWNAQLIGDLKTDAGAIHFRSFTSDEPSVQVIDLQTTGGENACKFSFSPSLAVNPRLVFRKDPIPEAEKNPSPIAHDENDVSLTAQPLRDGNAYCTAWKQVSDSADHRTIYLTVGKDKSQQLAETMAVDLINAGQSAGVANLDQAHQQWWHNYYPESFVSLPDTRLESFYWIQMYKLASATRSDRPAIDLMGPWFNATPWPKIWWNLNMELTYWPVLTSNRLELGESLCKLLDNGAENLANNAAPFSTDSAAVARTSSYDCVGPMPDFQTNGGIGVNNAELCNLPWIMHNYYLQYRYSMDRDMLRNHIFPLLKRSINYYLHLTKPGADGKLHITMGFSPEYPAQPTPNPDCNIDLSLLRWGCQTLLQTCDELKIDDPLIPTWKKTLEDLTPYPTDKNGLRISASVGFDESHRHFSHLLMIFPLYIMTPEQPANRELVIKSLTHWMSMPKALQGYSYTGAASISALLGKGDDAADYLNKLLDKRILPNTLYQESGPVIETPLSAAASLNDMLLSSWGDRIRVFPGIPSKWQDITFHNLRTQGAFLVSAVRKGGKTQFVGVESLAGEPCRIWTDITDPVVDGNIPLHDAGNGVIELTLARGQSAIIHPKNAAMDLTIAPVAAQADRQNFYGVHTHP